MNRVLSKPYALNPSQTWRNVSKFGTTILEDYVYACQISTTQHTASHCITLQHTATYCILNHTQHTATNCSTMQPTATHCILHLTGWSHSRLVQFSWSFSSIQNPTLPPPKKHKKELTWKTSKVSCSSQMWRLMPRSFVCSFSMEMLSKMSRYPAV